MKYSYRWLKTLSKTRKDPVALARMITLKGFELEGIEPMGARFDGFIVGSIVTLRPHPKADRLQLVTVDVGKKAPVEVVCRAWSIAEGDLVPVALPGAILPQHKLRVEAREVRGIVSNGMLCAEDELGIGKDHEGIVILGRRPDRSLAVGMPLAAALGFDDHIIELSILPNRAHDCLCHRGMAREICAMEGRPFIDQSVPIGRASADTLEVTVRDSSICPRYIGVLLDGITVAPSPRWMQARLLAAGMEPINNIVDITNYVMLEVGNPLHAFDASLLSGNRRIPSIAVRRARRGEQMDLLDGKSLMLDTRDLVITSNGRPVALAGIKGGKDSGINVSTRSIVLEAATFDGYAIRMTRQRHGLSTESQHRFEKGISPSLAAEAAARAIELLIQHAGARVVGLVDVKAERSRPQQFTFDVRSIRRLLGIDVAPGVVTAILGNLGFDLKRQRTHVYRVTVPAWRLDIEGPEDLAEEVGRIIGYENVPEAPIMAPVEVAPANRARASEWKVKDALCAAGMDEIQSYSFYGPEDSAILGEVAQEVRLENPLSPELSYLRSTLVIGVARAIASNHKNFDSFGLFKVGRCYIPTSGGKVDEQDRIAGGYCDASGDPERNFLALKGRIDALLSSQRVPDIAFRPIERRQIAPYRPRWSAIVMSGEAVLGRIGVLSPAAARYFRIKRDCAIFELDMAVIDKSMLRRVTYVPIPRFPPIRRDLSLFVPARTEIAAVQRTMRLAASPFLVADELFDVFWDKQRDRRSLAFRLTFSDPERTLSSAEADKLIAAISAALVRDCSAALRSE